jgi:RNA polymerase sigma factor (sigma-70 family)
VPVGEVANEAVTDARTSARPLSGDDFAAWVTPHLGLLAALAVREVGAADAPDIVQEALVRAWRRRSTYRADRGTPRAWLAGVLLDQARRHRVRRRVPPTPPDGRDAGDPAADRLDLERAVSALPRRQREVVTLHYLADLGVDEVASVLGISVGSVKSHLHHARARLRAAAISPTVGEEGE